jgi:hypothetical protein
VTADPRRPAPPVWRDRRVPGFAREWERATRGEDVEADPVHYLDQDAGVAFAVAASWLFCPETVEYRGGIFLKRRFSAANVDHWLEDHDLVTTQATVNLTEIWTLFDHAESPVFDDLDELSLVSALGECWYGILRRRYPAHDIRVSVDLDEQGTAPKGPSLTLWSLTN